MLEIAHAHVGERIGIARQGERGQELREVAHSTVNLRDLRAGREAQLDEGLDLLAELAPVERDGVPLNEPDGLEAIDTTLGRWWREVNAPTDLAGRATCVLG